MKTFIKTYFLLSFFLTSLLSIYSQKNSNPVGKISTSFDITPTGASTYSIPIEVVPGVDGMQPTLSINYNSQSGKGIIGEKWNLSGISTISREGKTTWLDTNLTRVELNSNDRFSYDGNRLIALNGGLYGANQTQYGTEVENFSRITSYGTIGNGPQYFKVINDQGVIMEYGSSIDSRLIIGNSCMIWALKKITDPNGNYMSYFYRQQNGELLIDSILYSKNEIIPSNNYYAKVSFSYIDDSQYSNTYYYAGYSTSLSKLLKTISIYYENNLVRKYELNYSLTNIPRLIDITLYGEDGLTHFNSTTFTWGNEVNNITSQNLTGVSSATRMIIGDFNGDGLSDYISYGENINNSYYWKFYINSGNNSYINHSQGIINSFNITPLGPYVADTDGDGADEFVIAELTGFGLTGVNFRLINFDTYSYSSNLIKTLNVYQYIGFGDFNGDGSCDIFFIDGIDSTYSTYGLPYNFVDKLNFDNINVISFSGNGKAALEVIKGSNTTIYEYNNSTEKFIFRFGNGFPTKWHNIYHGDFNGDGLTDILSFYNGVWTPMYAIGNGYYTNATTINLNGQINTGISNNPPLYPPLIADYNGDGKDDIIQSVYYSSTNTTTIYTCYSKGFFNGIHKFNTSTYSLSGNKSNINNYKFGDYNGDGKTDLFIKYPNSTPFVLFFNMSEKSNLIENIINEMGLSINIEYESAFVKCGTIPINVKSKAFLNLTKSTNISNGIGSETNRYEYFYSNPIYSTQRLAFLGFLKFVKKDIELLTTDSIISTYDYYHKNVNPNGKELLLPLRNVKIINYIKVLSEEFDSRYILLSNKRYISFIYNNTTKNFIDNTKITTDTRLNSEGRIIYTQIQNYELNGTSFIKGGKVNYTYTTVTLPNNIQSIKPLSIINEKYTNGSAIIVRDTTQYEYYSNGRIHRERKSIDDRQITSMYTYNSMGLIQSKSVSAIDCISRGEMYGYDNKYRFVTSIRNSLNQYNYFSYNPKNGKIVSQTDINGLITNFYYNSMGTLVRTTYPDGTSDSITFLWINNSSFPNVKYCKSISSTGLPIKTIYFDILDRELFNKTSNTLVETRFNDKGQLVKKSLPYNSGTLENDKIWNSNTYDTYGRIQTIIGPNTDLTYTYTSRSYTIQDNLRDAYTTKSYNASGELISSSDEGGTINYSEFYIIDNNKIKLKNEISTNGSTTTVYSDLWGNKLSLLEPNSGMTLYEYNNFNELTSIKDAKQNKTTYIYDQLGRVIQEDYYMGTSLFETYNYEYDYSTSTNFGKGLLTNVKRNNIIIEHYEYDDLSRIVLSQKYIDNISYSENYTYNSLGQLETLIYPNNFSTNYNYNSIGELEKITKTNNNSVLYKIYNRNIFGSPTRIGYGNNLTTEYYYNSFGMITQLKTGNKTDPFTGAILNPTPGFEPVFANDSTVQNIQYGYNNYGLMTSRTDRLFNQKEVFTYDNLDRLTSFYQGNINNSGLTHTFSYNTNGNIYNNTQTGNYSYSSSKPNAVTNVELTIANQTAISENQSDIKYNLFNQPDTIYEGDYETYIYYGANQQREKMITKKHLQNGSVEESTWYYINANYEKEIDKDGNVRHYNYIYGEDGLIAVCVQSASSDSMYYIHKDHLGSFNIVTNQSKQTIRRVHFDPWGNPKNHNNWTIHDTLSLFATNSNFRSTRGFTGHEHYPQYKIINMNGRLYDPVVARFFSPDNYVQAPGFTQGFNRYSYCFNNPLMYTDPSGEIVWYIPVIIGAVIGTYAGGVMANDGDLNPLNWDFNSGKTWGYMAGGSIVGGISGYVGWAVAGSGITLANTLGIAASSLANSIGTWVYTGFETPISMSLGIASINFTNATVGYLGKSGNTWSENLGYGFGALANISDIFSLIKGGGQNINVNSAKTTSGDWWSHSSITDENDNSLLSVGPDSQVSKASSLSATWKNSIKGAKTNWHTYVGEKGTWSIELYNVSTSAIKNYASGVSRWDLLLNSCVGHTSRALWSAGIPNIYLFHPYSLNAQLLIRQLGISASPFIYQKP